MELKVKKLFTNAQIPAYATPGASAFDLVAHTVNGAFGLGSYCDGDRNAVCGTGLAFEVPEGWVLLINSRSGHGLNYEVRLANCQGWIDSDYRGEVAVVLTCDDQNEDGGLFIKPGDRIAQAMLVPAPRIEFVEVSDLSDTERGAGGFGSTGQ